MYIEIVELEKLSSKLISMTEECQNCRKEVEKYVILEVAEFYDTAQDAEAASYEDAIVCDICWKDIKKNSLILKKIIKCI
jgi:hypothetical protein